MNPKCTSDLQDIVIDVRNVKKTFKSYKDKASSLKERFINPSRTGHEEVMVLGGISFQVRRGEAVGLIGKNGCGKSTTLKLLNKILYPNEGTIQMNGRISSLIELGAGFHPDMTGRENIYTNASIFGIRHKEVDRRLNDIIRFSELEDYIDNPVRTYSSGMYMRLAFAVAINVDADILLIDEILAVGDSSFQKKCFEKLKEIRAKGTTIVIVSHSMDQLYKICDRLIWLENGLIKEEGVPQFIGERYFAAMEDRRLERISKEQEQKKEEIDKRLLEESKKKKQEEEKRKRKQEEEEKIKKKQVEDAKKQEEILQLEKERKQLEKNESLKTVSEYCRPDARRNGNGQCLIKQVKIKNSLNEDVQVLEEGKTYAVEIKLNNFNHLKEIVVAIGFTREDGVYCYGSFTDITGNEKVLNGGKIKFSFVNRFLDGKYFMDFWVQSPQKVVFDEIIGLQLIEVKSDKSSQRGIFAMDILWE